MAVDPFAALGIEAPTGAPVAAPATQDSGADPFAALGVGNPIAARAASGDSPAGMTPYPQASTTSPEAIAQAWQRAGVNPLPQSSNSTTQAIRDYLAPDPDKTYGNIVPFAYDKSGNLHFPVLPNIPRGWAYALTESPTEATTINPNNGQIGVSPEAASLAALAAGGMKFGGPSAAVDTTALDSAAPLSKAFKSNPVASGLETKSIPEPTAPVSPTGIAAPSSPSMPLTPESAAGAKQVASAYYQAADTAGGTLVPAFTNRFIDAAQKVAPQTEEGLAVAGETPITGLVQRLQALKDKPISLQGAQEIDEELGNLIDHEYGPKGLSKNGKNLLDLQSTFRDMIANAGPNDIQGGASSFDALAQGRAAWAQAMKMGDLERIQQRADLTDNPATSIKSGIRVLLSNPTRARGYSEDEIAALKDAANRGIIGSALHVFGSRLIPIGAAVAGEHGGGPLGALLGGGMAHGGTSLLRGAAEALQTSRLKGAMETIAKNTPEPPGWTPPAAPQPNTPSLLQATPWRLLPQQPQQQPSTSINPATGLPEFSLEANKRVASGDMAQDIAGQMLSGTLSDHKALSDYVNQNKRQLRVQFGGQGIQNIMQVGALVRRATTEQTPSTIFSALLKGAAPDLMAKVGDPASLVSLAISQPELAKVLAARSGGNVNKIGQNRLGALLSAPDANGAQRSDRSDANERNATDDNGSNRLLDLSAVRPNVEDGAGGVNAPGASQGHPRQVPQSRVANARAVA